MIARRTKPLESSINFYWVRKGSLVVSVGAVPHTTRIDQLKRMRAAPNQASSRYLLLSLPRRKRVLDEYEPKPLVKIHFFLFLFLFFFLSAFHPLERIGRHSESEPFSLLLFFCVFCLALIPGASGPTSKRSSWWNKQLVHVYTMMREKG